jgi:hypothetical protein
MVEELAAVAAASAASAPIVADDLPIEGVGGSAWVFVRAGANVNGGSGPQKLRARGNRALAAAGGRPRAVPQVPGAGTGTSRSDRFASVQTQPFSLSRNGVYHFDSVILHSSELGPASFVVRTGLW